MTNREYLIKSAEKTSVLAKILFNISDFGEPFTSQYSECWERIVCSKVCDHLHPNVSEERRYDFCIDCPIWVSPEIRINLWLEEEADERFWEDLLNG